MYRVLWVFYLCGFWSLLLILVGLFHRSEDTKPGGYGWESRLLAIVPAHNEQSCIVETVYALMYGGCSVVVVADRCSDRTVELCEREGFDVFEVDEGNKGRAINRYLELSDLPEAFGGVTVVDCGSVVGPGFAARVMAGLEQYPFVQGWLRSSVAHTWVGGWYAWNYALYHLVACGRDLLGLPAMLGGTGFAWRSNEYVRFDARCLVEDLELSLRLHARGEEIGYCDVELYDEKPSTLRASFVQRLRWSRGAWWLLLHGRWLTLRVDDFVAAVGSASSLFWGLGLAYGLAVAPVQVMACVGVYMIVGAAAMVKLGQLHKWHWSLPLMIPFMSILEGVISIVALVTFNRKTWTRTEHISGRVSA